jgi:glutamate-1-semialdehyde 2,1-aminomutase
VSAGQRMQAHGWWREEPGLTDRAIRRSLLREMLGHLRPGV